MSGVKLHVRHYEWRGPFVLRLVDEAAGQGVVDGAYAILEEAYPYVPFEDGDLRDSGRAFQNRDSGGRFVSEAVVSYDTPYAVRLHEHPEYNFKGSGEGKWLEHAMQRRASKLLSDIAPPLIKVFRLP